MPDVPRRQGALAARSGIERRVAVLVGAGVLLATALVGATAWHELRGLERRRAGDRQWVANVLAQRLAAGLRRDLESLSELGASAGWEPSGADRANAHLAVRAVRFRARELAGVFLLGPDGTVVAEDPPGIAVRAPHGAARLELAAVERPLVSDAQADGRILLVVPLRDREGRPAGVACAVVDPRAPSWSAALAAPPGAAGLVEVVDGRGAVLARVGPARARPGEAAGRAQEPGSAQAAVEGSSWRVVVREPGRPLLGLEGGLLARLGAVGGGVLALALLFAWGAAKSVIEPLATLSRAAARMADGALHEPIPDLGSDQVGSLARSFEAMRQALARSLDETERARGELERRVEERTRELERLNRELRARDEARGRLLRKVIGAQEEERKRIARELHDQTCQSLAALGMRAEAALRVGSSLAQREGLTEARALAQRMLDEVHRVIFDLRPAVLDDLGLVPAIRWLGDRHLRPQGIGVRCEFSGLDARLPAETETALFRAVQEAVVNVARHARAQNVLIQASRQGEAVEIEIEDDGQGFDASALAAADPSGRGLGLLGIRERLDLLGGTAEIDSAPGLGARILLRAPAGTPAEAMRA
jgi:signal transduction histidine kinase